MPAVRITKDGEAIATVHGDDFQIDLHDDHADTERLPDVPDPDDDDNEPHHPFAAFRVRCPKCRSDDLVVIEYTLVADGQTYDCRERLRPDGFEVWGWFDDDLLGDTEDEVVACESCAYVFPLADITI